MPVTVEQDLDSPPSPSSDASWMPSLAEHVAALPQPERERILEGLSNDQAEALQWDWSFWGRPKQVAPPGDWRTWIVLAGRGFGKTRTGSQWFHGRAMEEPRELALIAKTPADARDYCVEGPGGLLRNTPPWERPRYEPSKRRLTWPNGSIATIYSSERPDQVRGFSGDTAWTDELAKYPNPEQVWDNLMFAMREPSSDRPRVLVTTTPRPLKFLAKLIAHRSTVKTEGSSYENRSNLDPSWFDDILADYEGTNLGRQEIWGLVIGETEGALWQRDWIRYTKKVPDLRRIVVAVDPPGSKKPGNSEAGIVVAGRTGAGYGYVLQDASGSMSTDEWAKRAIALYYEWHADRIVCERNFGGDTVEDAIRTRDRNVPVKTVWASRGKEVRAEPVVALYEQSRIFHAEIYPELEDQQCNWVPEDQQRGKGKIKADRMDALVWALTELFIKAPRGKIYAKAA